MAGEYGPWNLLKNLLKLLLAFLNTSSRLESIEAGSSLADLGYVCTNEINL